jgi:hypothetical protein
MATIKDLNAMDLMKGTVAVVVSVVATLTWADSHFITKENAAKLATKEKVDKLERIIVFQQLSLVQKDINEEKKSDSKNNERLKILYQQEYELKKELGVK